MLEKLKTKENSTMLGFSLKLLTFCFLLLTYKEVSTSPVQVQTDGHADVIVIGAGPSGIAAATKLHQKGINVKVFEAQSYIGGRVHSIKFGDAFVDLGAEWCHGEKNNVVFELMKESQVLTHPNYTFEIVDSNGNYLDEEFTNELHTLFESLYDTDGQRNATEEDTVGSYFTKAYQNAIKEKFSHNPKKYAMSKLIYHTLNKYILSSEGSFSWFAPSAMSDYKNCDGDPSISWNGLGYKTILEKLMENFDQQLIHLFHEVQHVIFDEQNDNVNVILSNGEKHVTKHVVFTPSLGVLKHDHKTLFQPSLSDEKVKAIDAIGIGGVMKVMLHFTTKWWTNESFSGVSFVWTQEDRDTLAVQFRKGPRKHGYSWLMDMMGVYRVEQNPNVLSCWFTGEFVPDIETLNQEILIEGIYFAMHKFMGDSVQLPDKIERTQWYTNKFIRGTYSYQTIASRTIKPSANLVLSQPIMNKANIPKILFAGEATHPYYYSTVHGAIESGFREADRLISIIKQ